MIKSGAACKWRVRMNMKMAQPSKFLRNQMLSTHLTLEVQQVERIFAMSSSSELV